MVLPLVTSGDFADGNSAKGKISNPAAAGLVKNGWCVDVLTRIEDSRAAADPGSGTSE